MGTALSGHEKPTEGLKAARTPPPGDTAGLDPAPIRGALIAELRDRYGVVAWFGFHTRRWWALAEDRLVEAETPDRLVGAVMAARRRAR